MMLVEHCPKVTTSVCPPILQMNYLLISVSHTVIGRSLSLGGTPSELEIHLCSDENL